MKSLFVILFLLVAVWAEDDYNREPAEIATVEGNLGLDRDLREETTVSTHVVKCLCIPWVRNLYCMRVGFA